MRRPKPGKTCPDAPADALLEGRKHISEALVLGHSHELDRRTTQEEQRERENSTSHPSYRAAAAERLVKEGKEANLGNHLMIS